MKKKQNKRSKVKDTNKHPQNDLILSECQKEIIKRVCNDLNYIYDSPQDFLTQAIRREIDLCVRTSSAYIQGRTYATFPLLEIK